MRTETVEFMCGDLARGHLVGSAQRCAWRHGLACSHERAGHTLRITVTGKRAEVKRFVAAMRYVFN